jgi:crotonobetainyl-CoA:carnitine CoA-transferase CaiB-like acyl-CoA transferase
VRTVPHATLGEVTVNGMPYHFNGAAPEIRHGPPVLGEHSEEILLELGFDPTDVARLIQSGAVETPVGTS